MKKKLLMAGAILASLTALYACSTIVPGKVVYSDRLMVPINNKDLNVKAAILVTAEGQLLFYDVKGEPLQQCRLPKSETDSKKIPICQGLTEDSAVTSIRTLPILKTNSETCWTFGPDASGCLYQFCW